MLLDQLAPPLLKKIFRKALNPQKIYENFDSAYKSLAQYKGYDNAALLDVVFAKSKNFINEIQNNVHEPLETHHVFLLTLIGIMKENKTIRVLDFGGAFGTHYFIAKKYFPLVSFDWNIIELPEVVKTGKALENSELKFIDIKNNYENPIGEFDLVITSCTLQHMPDPEKTLHFLSQHKAPYLALLRLGVNTTVKNLWIIHKAQFKDCGPGALPLNYQNGLAAFPFCLMGKEKLKLPLSQYKLKLSNLDNSGTISVRGYEIQGFNQLYTLST